VIKIPGETSSAIVTNGLQWPESENRGLEKWGVIAMKQSDALYSSARQWGLANLRRRSLTLIVAVTTVTAVTTLGGMAVASATAQAAAPTAVSAAAPTMTQTGTTTVGTTVVQIRKRSLNPELCLRNSLSHCAGFDAPAWGQLVLNAVAVGILVWKTINKKPGDGGTEESAEGEGTADGGNTDQGLCLTATGGNATMQSCTASGSAWIQYNCGDGICLENRWSYNRGQDLILSTRGNIDGYVLYVAAPGTSGDWQKWDWL